MNTQTSVLVVDDEEIVCHSCDRILKDEGFNVDVTTSPVEGLRKTETSDYSAILLDLKMQEMDGLEFLDQFRTRDTTTPVIVITGYPSQETADVSSKLGAFDYISKPFTPEELTKAVRKATERAAAVEPKHEAPVAKVSTWEATEGAFRFFNEAWLQIGEDATARIGAMVRLPEGKTVTSINLPRVGDNVFAGLPVASVQLDDGGVRLFASPVTGKIAKVNDKLSENPASLFETKGADAWIARVEPTRLEEDLRSCRSRNVLLVSTDTAKADERTACLAALGCTIHTAETPEQVVDALQAHKGSTVLLDASSLGDGGPKVAETIAKEFPEAKVVVFSDTEAQHEAEYRAQKILYYAVRPFEDGEIVDILNTACRSQHGSVLPEEVESQFLPKWVSRIHITNRNGTKVTLLSFGNLLLYHKGLGRQLVSRLLNDSFPLETTRGKDRGEPTDPLSQTRISNEAERCDRMVVLSADNATAIPSSLTRNANKDSFNSITGDARRKLVTYVVGRDANSDGALSFDEATTCALAEHIYREMVSL